MTEKKRFKVKAVSPKTYLVVDTELKDRVVFSFPTRYRALALARRLNDPTLTIIPPGEFKRQPGESREEKASRISRLIGEDWGYGLTRSWGGV